MKVIRIINKIWYYSYSLYFCLRYLPFNQAIKVPILVWPTTKIRSLHRGDIVLTGVVSKASVLLGFEGSIGRDSGPMIISISRGGRLYLGQDVNISRGTKLVTVGNGSIKIGNGFFCNGDCHFLSDMEITIGNDCLFGWDVDVNTTDGHFTYSDGVENIKSAPIRLKEHIWVCSNVRINKGVTIANDSVVAMSSLVSKDLEQSNCLYGGVPARLIKNRYQWKA
ncbi:MAG: acyltransferase [Muribaculaceae bacterium]